MIASPHKLNLSFCDVNCSLSVLLLLTVLSSYVSCISMIVRRATQILPRWSLLTLTGFRQ